MVRVWTLPSLKQLRFLHIATVVLALPCCFVFLRLILNGISAASEGISLTVGSAWLVVPLLALFLVAAANLPSLPDRTRALFTVWAFFGVLFLGAIPLALVFLL